MPVGPENSRKPSSPVPTKLSDEESKLLRQFAELRGESVAEPGKGLKSRIKSAFS